MNSTAPAATGELTPEHLRAVLEALADSDSADPTALLFCAREIDGFFDSLRTADLLRGLDLWGIRPRSTMVCGQNSMHIHRNDVADAVPNPLAAVHTLIGQAHAERAETERREREVAVQRVARDIADAENEAAQHWNKAFAVYAGKPPALAWKGYPLLDDSETIRPYGEPAGRIGAVAHLGDGLFLTHVRTVRRDYYDGYRHYQSSDTVRIIAPCGCGQIREDEVQDMAGLGDVMAAVRAGTCDRTCCASQFEPHWNDED